MWDEISLANKISITVIITGIKSHIGSDVIVYDKIGDFQDCVTLRFMSFDWNFLMAVLKLEQKTTPSLSWIDQHAILETQLRWKLKTDWEVRSLFDDGNSPTAGGVLYKVTKSSSNSLKLDYSILANTSAPSHFYLLNSC